MPFILFLLVLTPLLVAGDEILFETGFEQSEGYFPTSSLNGVNGWLSTENKGTGIPENSFFEGEGQQAFIGFAPFENISEENFSLFLWRPIDFSPQTQNDRFVQFRVRFQIYDSFNNNRDDFRWAFFNKENKRLFTLDFDNSALRINYLLGNSGEFIQTRTTFNNTTIYQLRVVMDFQQNVWNAYLNDTLFVENKRLVPAGAEPSLSDVSAIWAVRNVTRPGDNFMVFDDYQISTVFDDPTEPAPPHTVRIVRTENGLDLQASAERQSNWTIQGSDNLKTWTSLIDVTLDPQVKSWELDSSQTAGFWRIIPR